MGTQTDFEIQEGFYRRQWRIIGGVKILEQRHCEWKHSAS